MILSENLVKTFDGFTALDKLNLHVDKGSIYGLVGVNGAGKTTLIKHLAGVYRQDAGTVLIEGKPVYENIAIKERIGYIPDDLYFFPSYSIGNLWSFYKELYKNWDQSRFLVMMDLFKLNERSKLAKLSKGMQKQAAFVIAMSKMPDVLLLDEPIDGLDPIARRHVLSYIVEDVAARGLTVLISSHNLKELEGVCDTVGFMKSGTMSVERNLDDLKTDVHKVQLAFASNGLTNNSISERYNGMNVLHRQIQGAVEVLIIRGQASAIEAKIRSLQPVVYDVLPLSLEEIFIYGADEGFGSGLQADTDTGGQ